MLVITKNGQTRVYTGWKAWLIMAATLLVAWALFALIAVVFVGVALTAGIVLLLLVPAAAVVALVSGAMRK